MEYMLAEFFAFFKINGKSYRFKPIDLDKKQINKTIFLKYIWTSIFQFIIWAVIWYVFYLLLIRYPKVMNDIYMIMIFVGFSLFIYLFYQIKIDAFMHSIYLLKLQNQIITRRMGLWFLVLGYLMPLFNFVLAIVFYQWKNKLLIAQGYTFVNVKKLNQQAKELLLEGEKN